MEYTLLACLVGAVWLPTPTVQDRPSLPSAADIYHNAPRIVKAALRNVGIAPGLKKSPSREIRAPKYVPTYSVGESKLHRISLPPGEAPGRSRRPYSHHVSAPAKITPGRSYESIRRGEPPYVVIRPLAVGNRMPPAQKSKARIVLALPNDNIQILSADVSDTSRGSNIIPATVTLTEVGDGDRHGDGRKNFVGRNYGTSASKMQPQVVYNGQNDHRNYKDYRMRGTRKRHNFLPASPDSRPEDESDEDSRYAGRESSRNKPMSFDHYDDLISAGGQITFLKAQKAGMPKILTAQRASGMPVEAMKAILIEPKEMKAKRVTFVKSDARKVMPMKATLVKASQVTATKTKSEPVQVKTGSYAKAKTHRHDRSHMTGASNVHIIKVDPHMETGESRLLGDMGIPLQNSAMVTDTDSQLPPIDLQCGGNNDLGWCDLGIHYPINEVAQIIDVCEELVTRMYVETPVSPEELEDLQSYSMSHNITEHFNRRWDSSSWKTGEKTKKPLQGALCSTEKSVIQPSFAQDLRGKWHVIIQTDKFPQRVSLEVCKKPGDPCQNERCNRNSQCVQKYTYHHLISFDPETAETCPFTRVYKFPTSCVCRIASK